LIAACALFGFSVGNLITLPALIVQREFDPRSFGVLVSLITAINQITYAFGPGVVGLLHESLTTAAGHDVRPFLPLYGNVKPSGRTFVPVGFLQDVPIEMGGRRLSFSVFSAPISVSV
jgi:hypothetical protein